MRLGSTAVAACLVGLLLWAWPAGSATAGRGGVHSGPRPATASSIGSTLWVDRYNSSVNLDDSATSIAIGRRGHRLFVTGYSQTGPRPPEPYDDDFVTVAQRAANGKPLWRARYDGPDSSSDAPTAIATGSSPSGGRLYVTGSSFVGDDAQYATVAYEARTGRQLWAARFDGVPGADDVPVSVAASPDGSAVYVTGTGGGARYLTVAYDSSTGRRLWVARHRGLAKSLAVDPEGSSVYVTGHSPAGSSADYATVAYDAGTGDTLWVATYDGPAGTFDGALFTEVSPDGSAVYATGQSLSHAHGFDYATVAYSASDGEQRWVSRYNGPGGSTDTAWHLAVSPDGSRLYVTGDSVGSGGDFDYGTVAYRASDGRRRWVARYDGPAHGDDLAESVVTSPSGSAVYVTGTAVYGSGESATLDYGTVAYGAGRGARHWVARYNGPAGGHENAAALAISPLGCAVYVTGESEGVSTHPFDLLPLDYATVAYRTKGSGQLFRCPPG